MLADLQNKVHSLNNMVEEQRTKKLPRIAWKCSEMQATLVITDDYNLKLERQNYYLDKLRELFECLITQRIHSSILCLILVTEGQVVENLMDFKKKAESYLIAEQKGFQSRMVSTCV